MFKRKGQVVIEMIMVIVVFILMLALMLSMFQLMHNKMITSYAAYIGAREYAYYIPNAPAGHEYDKAAAERKAKETLALFVNPQDLNNFTITVKHIRDNQNPNIYYSVCTVEGEINYIWNWGNPLGGKKVKTTIAIIREEPISGQVQVGNLH